ncbi:MAG: 4a-hydroxytetrahydrobiopterin dehydratase [Nitrospirae bacterium]|nr:4a-hydroxytetrahydrobiopterin dehydratase [Nitrospirota bacterium]
MSAPPRAPADIEKALEARPGWKHRPNEIHRTYKFATFLKAIDFVNRIAEHSESVDHHPDITIRYTSVSVALSTHSERGVTDKDLAWADATDRICAELSRG